MRQQLPRLVREGGRRLIVGQPLIVKHLQQADVGMHVLLLVSHIVDVGDTIAQELPPPVLRELHQAGLVEEPPRVGDLHRVNPNLLGDDELLCLEHALNNILSYVVVSDLLLLLLGALEELGGSCQLH